MNFSIVIPAWNRSELVDALLESLHAERERYRQGETEVLVVDSSAGAERERIVSSCERYDAVYIEGDDSVRKKRNKGIKLSAYEHILFLDSDVTVKEGILDEYVKAYQNPCGANLGGVLGYTEFVGEKTFWWKALERTNLMDSFSFAREYPFHSWTIGNNVSFRKSVLEEAGMFEENFPFKLGGDDLDMSYRVTKAGYLIGSAPEAVAYHSRKTWSSYKAAHDRARRWGTMENFIVERHPELYQRVIPKSYLIELAVLLSMGALAALLRNGFPLAAAAGWIAANWGIDYAVEAREKGFCSPVYFAGARMIQAQYEFYRVYGSLKKGSAGALYKGIIFNRFQIKFGMAGEAFRIKKLIWSFLLVGAIGIACVQYLIQ